MTDDHTELSGEYKTRIFIVDDHPLVREGLTARIAVQPDMEVCGEADSVGTALVQIKAINPDLCIVDIQLVDSHGLELIKELHQQLPQIKLLVVSAFAESFYAERALRAGAHGYINKRELQDSILDALRTVASGQRYLSSKMMQVLSGQLIGNRYRADMEPTERLSDRELEVFQLIGQGKTVGAIAGQLFLSRHTIDTHREKIKRKLNLSSASELQRAATQWILENT